ncbi:hypothetical protein [Chryseobacterium aquaticum]|uniref:hypothetical protein n=1 Tax=Chryseobacterium aquaticum TaxID=452084 RepID=UPI003F72AD3C
MPFLVKNDDSQYTEFNELEFIDEEKIFKLISSTGNLNVAFEPKILDKSFETSKMKVFFFQNIYLNAENDVFQVYLKKNRVGWIFPLQALISDENDFTDNPFFNKYKYATYKKILERQKTVKKITIIDDVLYSLSDFYGENVIILCISLETLPDEEFEVENFLPSLANYGYFILNDEEISIKTSISKQSLFSKYKGCEKIKIHSSKINLSEHNFLKNLYINHLKKIEDNVLKFFMLYQVIEYLLEKEFNIKFDSFLADYHAKKIDKNSFREKINEWSKERKLIKHFSTTIAIPDELVTDFSRDAKLFLENFFHKYEKEDVGDLIYDIRNILIHRYRDIDILSDDKLVTFELITEQLELIINEYLINYK